MMNNKTRHTDTDQQRIEARRQQRHGQWSLTLLAGLILMAISGPAVWAKVSDTTGPINGTAPTATGTLSVLFPDGVTAVTNNAVMRLIHKPVDFKVSASSLTLQDLDGDTGLSSSLDTAAVTWVWKYNNVVLTPAQLSAPFGPGFLGKTLTVAASVPVTVSSLTGAPTTGSPGTLSSATYTVIVARDPVVRVNGYSFAMNVGFPKTGFVGATFQFWMDGYSATGNSNYTFTSDQSWVTVDANTGVMTFNSKPASENKTATITITEQGGGSRTYTFTVGTWFVNKGAVLATPAVGPDSYCAAIPGYAAASYSVMTNAAYQTAIGQRAADGRLWDEWGDMSVIDYAGSGWVSDWYWGKENIGNGRSVVHFGSGGLNGRNATASFVVCSQTL
ncbi:BACON domain-containing protein [Yersinia intermedia]|uniref:BACON domain-containing protein n=1 Tax=Yersinia intermedia TaxID=631 RepID=UPI000B766369|nr:BACON domain-containing protein [Yersinia intermedia]MCW8114263.1 BACON domain-containing protein [Yersinia intermedia]MDA5519033.1 BACON domain-containing protein [Yersinia intermedia]OWF85746.1 hypothetical protein B4916_23180 [Yersinia intermedia]